MLARIHEAARKVAAAHSSSDDGESDGRLGARGEHALERRHVGCSTTLQRSWGGKLVGW